MYNLNYCQHWTSGQISADHIGGKDCLPVLFFFWFFCLWCSAKRSTVSPSKWWCHHLLQCCSLLPGDSGHHADKTSASASSQRKSHLLWFKEHRDSLSFCTDISLKTNHTHWGPGPAETAPASGCDFWYVLLFRKATAVGVLASLCTG